MKLRFRRVTSETIGMKSEMKRDAYWAKTCFSLGFWDGFLPKNELNMAVVREAFEAAVIAAAGALV